VLRVEVRAAEAMPGALLSHIHEVEEGLDWGAPADVQWGHPMWHVLVWRGDTLVAHAGLVRRRVLVSGQLLETAGLSSVWSLPSERGNGYAHWAVTEAMAYASRELGAPAMLLLCRAHVAAFYQRLSWRQVEGGVTFAQPTGPYRWPALTMSLSCDDTPWPDGDIDLCGLPW